MSGLFFGVFLGFNIIGIIENDYIFTLNIFIAIAIVLACGALFFTCAYYLKEVFVIIWSSFNGGVLFVYGIGIFTGQFPIGRASQSYWVVYVYLGVAGVMFISGLILQCIEWKKVVHEETLLSMPSHEGKEQQQVEIHF